MLFFLMDDYNLLPRFSCRWVQNTREYTILHYSTADEPVGVRFRTWAGERNRRQLPKIKASWTGSGSTGRLYSTHKHSFFTQHQLSFSSARTFICCFIFTRSVFTSVRIDLPSTPIDIKINLNINITSETKTLIK